jgi:RHS repeat-associated protein
MIRTHRSFFLLIALALGLSLEGLAARTASAQVRTGTPPYGSFAGGPDVIDLANLNVHLAVPVLNKPGRGMNFAYDISYDSSVWYPVGTSGSQVWTPVYNLGWRGNTEIATGYLSSNETITDCWYTSGRVQYEGYELTQYSLFVYHDPWGVSHPFSGSTKFYQPIHPGGTCVPKSNTSITNALATDGSGLVLNVPTDTEYGTITSSSGKVITPPAGIGVGAGTAIDRNGNEISVSNSGVFTDTLGTTVMTVSGSGTASSPTKLTYTAPSGASPYYQINYTNYTVATNFGITGITDYKSLSAVPLVTSVALPDGSQYGFSYEATPGTCSPYAGTTCVTARIASVTLPTGGTITYAYSGGNNGILPDGSTATLTRTLSDGASWNATWAYAQVKNTGAASTTTITDPERDTLAPSGNQTVIQFQGIYETQRQVYQGSTSGTLLATTNTCYNGTASPASTAACTGTVVSLPITQRAVTTFLPGSKSLTAQHIDDFNAYGVPTESDDYDYGSGVVGALLRKVLYTYASLGNITAFQQQVTVQNGAGATVAQTNYNYDETAVVTPTNLPTPQHTSITGSRGNLTSINYPVSGLTSHYTYFDTGNLQTSKDVNGATTTYTYGALTATCGNAFPTGVTEPMGSMSQSLTWNCTGGVMTQLTDENSQNLSASYTDPYFWRPVSTTDQTAAVTNLCYGLLTSSSCTISPNRIESYLNFNSGSSTADSLTTLDGLGRPHVKQTRQGPASSTSNFDSAEVDYDALGRPNRSTMPYSQTAGQTNSSAPAVATTYDALGRVLTKTDAANGTTAYTYNQNDVLVVVGPHPSGENTKQRQLEYDSLGRLTSVCEVTSILPGNGSCAQNNAQSGYWTKYSFDALGDLLTVTQNAQASSANQQTRTYVYDAMSRLTSEKNPEAAQVSVTYAYDTISSGTCAGTSYGDLLKRVDAIGNITCYTFDLLHRTLSQTYTVTSPTVATPGKYFVYDAATVNSTSMQNTKTRLAETYTCVTCPGSKITDVGLSYSARGEITDVYELTPHSGGTGAPYNHTTAQFWPSGALNQLTGPVIPTITYGADGEGRPSTVSDGSSHAPVTSTTYNLYTAPPQLQVTFGSSDSDVFSFDPNTFRLNKYQFNVGSQAVTGTLGWNANGSLGSLNISDAFNSANTQNCAFAADDLSRVSQVSCGTIWGQNFTYDPFGNIQKVGISGSGGSTFSPTYQSSPSITNRVSQVGSISATYDANGNSTNDTFRTFTWDAENRPVTIGSLSLTYDALGRMVEQSTGSVNSEIVYNPLGVKLALMSGTTLMKGFVPLTGGATAVYTSSGLAYYRHSDHLGSSRFASTPTQTLYADLAYSPSGEPYAQSGAIDPSFTGQNQDTTAGLYDFMYREHDPNQSRWTSPDPSGLAAVSPTNPQTWNRYAYVANNPMVFTDPTGLFFYPCSPGGGCDWGGNNCTVDNASSNCGYLGYNGMVPCPNNMCSGFNADGRPVYFWASTNGPGKYYTYLGPGALYYSADQAGIAAGAFFILASVTYNREYGGGITEDANGVFSYYLAAIGEVCAPNEDCLNSFSPGPNDVADWHTHPYEGNKVQFLGDQGAEYNPVPDYVTTPEGSSFGTFLIGPWQGGILYGGQYGPLPANIEMIGPPHVAPICQLSGPTFSGISPCH